MVETKWPMNLDSKVKKKLLLTLNRALNPLKSLRHQGQEPATQSYNILRYTQVILYWLQIIDVPQCGLFKPNK